VVFFLVLLYPFLYYFSRKSERYPQLNRWRRFYSQVSSVTAGFFFRYYFEAPIDWSRHYIICANHTSNLDIPAISYLVKGNFAFMGKDDLLGNPVTGLFFRTIDIPLNRNSKMSAFRAFKRAGDYLKQGISLVIFPEGRISDGYPPQLGPFKIGPFRLAIEHNVPIIPISIPVNYKRMWDDGSMYGTTPGTSDIYVHAPVDTNRLNMEDADDLRITVYNIINSKLA
jgi:1-acyl-sn-glycerol-3-phosphate acyltransferase